MTHAEIEAYVRFIFRVGKPTKEHEVVTEPQLHYIVDFYTQWINYAEERGAANAE